MTINRNTGESINVTMNSAKHPLTLSENQLLPLIAWRIQHPSIRSQPQEVAENTVQHLVHHKQEQSRRNDQGDPDRKPHPEFQIGIRNRSMSNEEYRYQCQEQKLDHAKIGCPSIHGSQRPTEPHYGSLPVAAKGVTVHREWGALHPAHSPARRAQPRASSPARCGRGSLTSDRGTGTRTCPDSVCARNPCPADDRLPR